MARGNNLEGRLILKVGEVAKQLRWTRNRTKRWLAKEGILHKQPGHYGATYTTFAELRLVHPQVVDDIRARMFND